MSVVQSLKNSYTYVGILLMIEGLLFLLLPNLTTKLLLLKPLETLQAEQYARTLGIAVTVLGYYYFISGKHTLIEFYRASVIGRLTLLPIISLLIYFCSVEISFLLFGIQDLITALWSYKCLKAYDEEQTKIKK